MAIQKKILNGHSAFAWFSWILPRTHPLFIQTFNKYLLRIPTMCQTRDIVLGSENATMNHSATAPVFRVYTLEEEDDEGQTGQTKYII